MLRCQGYENAMTLSTLSSNARCTLQTPSGLELEGSFTSPGQAGSFTNPGQAGSFTSPSSHDNSAAPGAVVAPPHPVYGGTLSNPVVARVREGFHAAGWSTLAFNYRGTEASEGEVTDSLEAAVEDYLTAARELRARVAGPYVYAGYSFGAGTALLAAQADAAATGLVLVAPPIGMLREADLTALRGHLLVVVGDDDAYAPLDALRQRLAVRSDCVLTVLPGVDHFFHFGGLAQLSTQIAMHVQDWR